LLQLGKEGVEQKTVKTVKTAANSIRKNNALRKIDNLVIIFNCLYVNLKYDGDVSVHVPSIDYS